MILRPTIALAACSLAAGAAQAQLGPWSVRVLGSPTVDASFLASGDGTHQVGYFQDTWRARPNAVLWNGADSFVNLNPPDAEWSTAGGVTNGYQYGTARIGGSNLAVRWSGSAESWTSINPPGSRESWITAAGGGQQVGFSIIGNQYIPTLWSGTAQSWVNLNVRGYRDSVVRAVGGGMQVGLSSSFADGKTRAGLWRGTAQSWVELHPAGAERSDAFGTDGLIQVGIATFKGRTTAGLWRGSADSWLDLAPTAISSAAYGAAAGFQVGSVDSDGRPTSAAVWNGTADSFEDIGQFLPTGWLFSIAGSVWIDGKTLYVGGTGIGESGRIGAILWSRTIPAPGSASILVIASLVAARRRR